MYYSLPDEVDTHHYIDQLVSRGKRVILPVVLDDTNMELREYSGVQDLKEGAYHILEPKGKIYPEEKYPEIELAVIPGMSFDMKGNRLGRGKGYYDRSSCPDSTCIQNRHLFRLPENQRGRTPSCYPYRYMHGRNHIAY